MAEEDEGVAVGWLYQSMLSVTMAVAMEGWQSNPVEEEDGLQLVGDVVVDEVVDKVVVEGMM